MMPTSKNDTHVHPLGIAIFGAIFLVSGAISKPVEAQSLPPQTSDDQMGLAPYQSYAGGNIDSIGLSSGTLSINVPFLAYSQRGKLHLSFNLFYNDQSQHQTEYCPTKTSCIWIWGLTLTPSTFPLERSDVFVGLAQQAEILGTTVPLQSGNTYYYYTNFSLQTADGAKHVLANLGSMTNTGSPPDYFEQYSGPWESLDATGWRVNGTFTSGPETWQSPAPNSIIGADGVSYLSSKAFEEDPNGNMVSLGTNGVLTDSLGRSIPLPPTASSTSNTTTENCPQEPLPAAFAVLWSVPSPGGGTASYKFCYASVAINIPPGNPSGTYPGLTGSSTKLQSIVLPNLTTWNFTYNDPGNGTTYNGSPINYGTLTQVTLPTGGTISYAYTTIQASNSTICQNAGRWVTSRTVSANDGKYYTWQYSYNVGVSTTVTEPSNDYVVHTFGLGQPCTLYETVTQSYQHNTTGGTLLKTVNTQYNTAGSANMGSGFANVAPNQITTTWANNQTSEVTKSYDSGYSYRNYIGAASTTNGIYGLLQSETDYDYGSGSHGSALKTTNASYFALNNSSYLSGNLLNLLSSIQIQDGGGTQRGYTTYSYDGSSLAASGISTQHDPSPPDGNNRGNLTEVYKWLNTSGTYITNTNTYYDTGMPDVMTDANSNATTYTYSSTDAGAYPTAIKNSLNQTTNVTWDFNTGLLASITDPNNQATHYSYNTSREVTQVSYPDGGQRNVSYPTATEVEISDQIDNSGNNRLYYVEVDGLARKSRTAVTNGESTGFDQLDFCYDDDGRLSFASYPYQDSGPFSKSTCSTAGDSYSYDGIDRVIALTHSDSSSIATSYSGNSTTVTDEAGHARETLFDGFGRMEEVIEDPSNYDYVAAYSYDALDNLTGVTQAGSRQRTFVYDSLSRLISSTNPESNTNGSGVGNPTATTYSYDSNGNVVSKTEPAPNQPYASTITLSYCYDALNRMTAKAYTLQTCTGGSMPSPLVTYSYDGSSCGGLSPCLNIGRRTGMVDQAGSETWLYSYNQSSPLLGLMISDTRTTNLIQKSSVYQYNHLGSLVSLEYPSGRTVNYVYNVGDRPVSVQDASTSVYYANTVHYLAGGVQCWAVVGGAATTAESFNGRLQPIRIQATGTVLPYSPYCPGLGQTGSFLDLSYSFTYSSLDNGNVEMITNNRDTTRSETFSYDDLNRITNAQTTSNYSTSPAHCWAENYQFDNQTSGGAWGNLSSIAQVTGPYVGCTQESGLSVNIKGTNRIGNFGYSYDTAGNLIGGPASASYTFDAENHLTATAGITYAYDGDGKRVEKIGSKIYWYGMDGNVLDETDSTGSTTNASFAEYVFVNGARAARRDSSNNVLYYFADHLGTSRANAEVLSGQNTSTMCYDADFYPFGAERPYTSTCLQNYKFSGKERDAESSLDYFGARFNSFAMGRFMSPDPSNAGADPTDPQTWNMYSYVANRPLSYVDPSGLDCIYFNDAGNGVEWIDSNSNGGECNQNGGDWVNGTTSLGQITYDQNTDIFNIQSSDAFTTYSTTVSAPGSQISGVPCYGDCTYSYSQNNQVFSQLLNFLSSVPWSGSLFLPLVPFGPHASGAAGLTGAVIPNKKTICAGFGAGAQAPAGGRSATGGPLLFGNLSNADAILSGGSVNVGLQLTPSIGFQAIGNSSGVLGGPTFGNPGVSVDITASACKKL
jgi:RHS repeat-associated protein